jgi:hypothetical protein
MSVVNAATGSMFLCARTVFECNNGFIVLSLKESTGPEFEFIRLCAQSHRQRTHRDMVPLGHDQKPSLERSHYQAAV